MTKYEKLIIEAENIGIEVREIDFGSNKKGGRCLNNIIYINSRMLETEKYEVLAEEIGHYKTTLGNILNQDDITNRKLENIARREGYKTIVEPIDIVEAMRHGSKDIHDMAEYVGVRPGTLIDILNDYKKQYGVRIRVGNYCLILEPWFGIIQDYGGFLQY